VTAVEFFYPIKAGTQRVLVTAALYYGKHYCEPAEPHMTPTRIKAVLMQGGVTKARKMNTGRALAEASPHAHREGPQGAWAITGTGEELIRRLLRLSGGEQAENDVSTLEGIVERLGDENVRDYIEEAIKCLAAGALRASVVFLWSGAVHTIRETMWSNNSTRDIEAALVKHNQRSKFKKKGDFEYVNDALLIDAAVELEVVDRSEKKRLSEALDLRNDCGHPVKYRPGPNKVRSFIEDITNIVFPPE